MRVGITLPKLFGIAGSLLSVAAITACAPADSSAEPAASADAGQVERQPDYPGMPGGEVSGDAPRPKPRPTASTQPVPDYQALAKQQGSGVFKIVATGCDQGSQLGSAFLIDDRTAVTSYAVVAGSKVAALISGSTTVGAKIAAVDADSGVAVLKLDRAVDGHVFKISAATPQAEHPVGLLGVSARGRSVRLVESAITETDLEDGVSGRTVGGLGRADADVDPGMSGGPTLDADGRANGMALGGSEEGPLMIISGKVIKEAVSGRPEPEKPACSEPYGPPVTAIGGRPPRRVQELFRGYFGGINTGDYRKAYEHIGPAGRTKRGYAAYRDGWISSYDFNIVVHSASRRGARVTFDSIFLPGHGPKASITCARWDIDYTFVEEDGRLLINKAEPHRGRSEWRPC